MELQRGIRIAGLRARGYVFRVRHRRLLRASGRPSGLEVGPDVLVKAVASSELVLGRNVRLGPRIQLHLGPGARLTLGDRARFTGDTVVSAWESVTIASGVGVAEFVSVRDANHRRPASPEESFYRTGFDSAPIDVGPNVWVGRGAYIGPGVTIGPGAVVGANAVVLRDVPRGALAVGVPARVIERSSDS
jgi:acetyltransferase-like isoleucine patch superfamily enzyme